jgi:hypothetical protein
VSRARGLGEIAAIPASRVWRQIVEEIGLAARASTPSSCFTRSGRSTGCPRRVSRWLCEKGAELVAQLAEQSKEQPLLVQHCLRSGRHGRVEASACLT